MKVCPEGAIREVERAIGVVERGHCRGVELIQGRLNVGEPLAPPLIHAVKAYAGTDGVTIVDATCPFGYGRILPAGLLREPVNALKRADAVVITRYDQASVIKISELEKAIERIAPQVTIAKAVHCNPYAKMLKGATLSIDELKEKPVYAFCGIGNPKAFFNRLEGHGLKIMGTRIYNDHHNYTQQDIKDIYEEAKYLGAELILSTQKDWVKTTLLSEQDEDILFAYMAVELEFVEGADKIESLVAGAVGLETGCKESGVHDA